MDGPGSLDDFAEEWLWSLEWAKAGKTNQDWTGIIKCLRRRQDDDCAIWAELVEALVGGCSPKLAFEPPADARPAHTPTEYC
jgi:hypothetical protein